MCIWHVVRRSYNLMGLTPSELISWKCIFTTLSATINQGRNLISNSPDAGAHCLLFFCRVYQELAQASDGWLCIWLPITREDIFHSPSVRMWLARSGPTKLITERIGWQNCLRGIATQNHPDSILILEISAWLTFILVQNLYLIELIIKKLKKIRNVQTHWITMSIKIKGLSSAWISTQLLVLLLEFSF